VEILTLLSLLSTPRKQAYNKSIQGPNKLAKKRRSSLRKSRLSLWDKRKHLSRTRRRWNLGIFRMRTTCDRSGTRTTPDQTEMRTTFDLTEMRTTLGQSGENGTFDCLANTSEASEAGSTIIDLIDPPDNSSRITTTPASADTSVTGGTESGHTTVGT
jgi:hypothetical protein